MANIDTIINCILELVLPWVILGLNLCHIPLTIKDIVKAGDYSKLISFSDFRALWFAKFWTMIGPQMKLGFEPDVAALLQGRVLNGKVHSNIVSQPVSGVVLEIGTGPGTWTEIFASIIEAQTVPSSNDTSVPVVATGAAGHAGTSITRKSHDSTNTTISDTSITKIYGVEPNPSFAASLRKRVTELQLEGIYEVVPVGIEQIIGNPEWHDKIQAGSIDSIVCICCLCTIPNAEENIRSLYQLLKPGGKLYIHEHVKCTRGGFFMEAYQCKSYYCYYYLPKTKMIN